VGRQLGTSERATISIKTIIRDKEQSKNDALVGCITPRRAQEQKKRAGAGKTLENEQNHYCT
jgi:hypothetical protein